MIYISHVLCLIKSYNFDVDGNLLQKNRAKITSELLERLSLVAIKTTEQITENSARREKSQNKKYNNEKHSQRMKIFETKSQLQNRCSKTLTFPPSSAFDPLPFNNDDFSM